MDLNKLKGNSHNGYKMPVNPIKDPGAVTQIAKASSTTKKLSVGALITNEIKGDDERPVGQFILETVVIPKAKDMVSDIAKNGLEMVQDLIDTRLFGAPRSRTKSGGLFKGSSYNYQRGLNSRDRRKQAKYENICLSTRAEAQDVLNAMLDRIDDFGAVSVADLYEMVGETSTYQDRKIGWDRLRTAEIIKTGREYLLSLPAVQHLD